MLTSALLLITLTTMALALPSPTTLPFHPILPSLTTRPFPPILLSLTARPFPPILPSPTTAPSPPTTPSYPPFKTARAFRLVFNVTDPSKDFPAPNSLHGSELWPRDFFGPESTRGTVFPPKSGGLFFQTPLFNGGQPLTDDDRYRSSLQAQYGDLILGFFGYTPFVNTTVAPVRFYKGSLGTEGVQLGVGGDLVFVNTFEKREGGGGRFVVCNETIVFPTGPGKWLTLGLVADNAAVVPKECVEVNLLPECDRLGFVSEHAERKAVFEAASEVRCYEDVQGTEWAKYSS